MVSLRIQAIEQSSIVMKWDERRQLARLNDGALALLQVGSLAEANALPSLAYDNLFTSTEQAALTAGTSLTRDLAVRDSAGGEAFLSATVQPLRDAEGQLRRTVIYAMDVSARRKSVRESE